MLRVLLVDDERLARERLALALREMPQVEVVGVAADGDDALAQVQATRPDLILLDIQMPGLDGLSVAKALAGGEAPEVIFVSAFEHYAPAAFELDAVDYLLKPVKFERLRLAMDRALRRRQLRGAEGRAAELEQVVSALRAQQRGQAAPQRFADELWVPTRQGSSRLAVAQIDWIEAARDYVLLHTATRSHILRATMAQMEAELDPAQVGRVHRSAFVNWNSVAAVERPGRGALVLLMRDGAKVAVGASYVARVQERLKLES